MNRLCFVLVVVCLILSFRTLDFGLWTYSVLVGLSLGMTGDLMSYPALTPPRGFPALSSGRRSNVRRQAFLLLGPFLFAAGFTAYGSRVRPLGGLDC